jgi:hypothetical protein
MSIGADLSQREKGLILRRSDLAEYPKNFAEAFLCNSEGVCDSHFPVSTSNWLIRGRHAMQ